jgi:hypothetical protein
MENKMAANYQITKFRPTVREVHINGTLSNISIAYHNNEYIWNQIFPVVPVQHKTDSYFVFDRSAFLRNRSGIRAPGTRAPLADWGLTTASYVCINDSMGTLIPDEVRMNADAAIKPDITATRFVSDALDLAEEIRVATLLGACATWAAASAPTGTSLWSNDGSDPFADILTAQDAVVGQLGRMPNVAVMSWKIWRRLQNHPALLERLRYTRPGATLTENDLKSWFGFDKVLIGKALYDAAKEGATPDIRYVWGNTFWTGYVTPSPAIEEPSAGYVLRWGNREVRKFRLDPEHTDLIEAGWWVAEVVTASDSGAGFYSVL